MSNLNSQIVDIINNFLEEYNLVDARTCKDEFLGMHSSLTIGGANEVVKEIEKVIANQVREARIDELERVKRYAGAWFRGDERLVKWIHIEIVDDRIKELGEKIKAYCE